MATSQLSCDVLHLSSELSFICQHSPPLVSGRSSHPGGLQRVVIWHHPSPHLALNSLDSSLHQPVYLLWTHRSPQLWFWKWASKCLLLCKAVNTSGSSAAFCLMETPRLIIQSGGWVRFPSSKDLLDYSSSFFTFVILQPLAETDEVHSMFYFHIIYILLIETQASVSRMTLKKSWITFYNVTLQDSLIYGKFLVSQKEGDFYGWFWGCIIFWKVKFLLSVGLALWNCISTVRTNQVIWATVKCHVSRDCLLCYRKNSRLNLIWFLRQHVCAWRKLVLQSSQSEEHSSSKTPLLTCPLTGVL